MGDHTVFGKEKKETKDKQGKKKKKKKQPTEQFQSLTANGAQVQAINVTVCKNPDGTPRLEVRTPDVAEQLHFSHVDFELRTNLKLVKVGANFKEAVSEKRFKLYVFDIDAYEQFFI